ncbi:hypothetical protein GCM10010331_69470 [Streptomyces xanthochromogenes]|nr:hypothetical protein [Streptomyces xanthochromogenes]GHB71642.1 hypothetical protein GCM10010331_69470 [Streptomyces xanthochromogenes]
MAFDDAGAVRQGEAGSDGLEILAYGVGEDADGIWASQLGLLNPVPQQVTAALAKHSGEVPR